MDDIRTSNTQTKTVPPKLISFWLDDYDNLFSDFDPRSYSKRALSDDFLHEAKKLMHMEKSKNVQISFLIPVEKRNRSYETVIKARLTNHFKQEHEHLKSRKKRITRKGVLTFILGVILMTTAAYITTLDGNKNLLIIFLRVFLEPAGWFIAWQGLDQILNSSSPRSNFELNFDKVMAAAKINFDSYKPENNNPLN